MGGVGGVEAVGEDERLFQKDGEFGFINLKQMLTIIALMTRIKFEKDNSAFMPITKKKKIYVLKK